MNSWNNCLNVLIAFPTGWNKLSNNMRRCFTLDYLITVRIVAISNLLILRIILMNFLIVGN